MEKIVIIGSPGAGKSTLARELGSILKVKFFHLDRLFWQRGWRRKTGDDRIDILQKIVLDKQWIIEGTYLKSSEPRLDAADTIIFLDISPLICLLRIIQRHREDRGRPRRDLPKESTDKLDWLLIWNVLAFPFTGRRMLKQKLRNYESKRIIWLRSPKKVEDFLAQQKQVTDNKSNSRSTVPVAKRRGLVATGR